MTEIFAVVTGQVVPFSSRDKSKKDYLVGLDEKDIKMEGGR